MSDTPGRLDVARVLTPSTVITKARVAFDEDGSATVTDRRTKAVLLRVEGPPTATTDKRWSYGDVTIERMSGCGCGGTRQMPTGG